MNTVAGNMTTASDTPYLAEPRQISLAEWDGRYSELKQAGMTEPPYGGPLSRHVAEGDLRLPALRFDNSAASLDLWNFLLSEESRLRESRRAGKLIVGTMKDLGTVPVMAFSLDNTVAFYPDGAWWLPCIMQKSTGLLAIADSLGIDDSFCPVRAMLGAFLSGSHFPRPDLLTCSVGATCDDFSAIAQRLNGLGYPILWWEMPHRRHPSAGESAVRLPGGCDAPRGQVAFVESQLGQVKSAIESLAGETLDDTRLRAGIEFANRVRDCLATLRRLAYTADPCPMPALEMLIAEMLAIHFCSDRAEALRVLSGLLREVRRRIACGEGVLARDAARIFWVNPVADLRVMNILEESGGKVCGTEYLFTHALDRIPTDIAPMQALARTALADPMAGSTQDRAARICDDMRNFGSEALLVSRIPGASHCALEGRIIADAVRSCLGLPVQEIEVPPLSDSCSPTIRTRLEGLVETVRERRAI